MDIFSIYNDLVSGVTADRQYINSELLIGTKYKENNFEIDSIYAFVLDSLSEYRLENILTQKLHVNQPCDLLENAMKNHCIIRALYTIESIIQSKDDAVPLSKLGNDLKWRGYHEIQSAKINQGKSRYLFDDSSYDDEATAIFRGAFESITKAEEYPYFIQLLDVDKENKKVSAFLSDFTYHSILTRRKASKNNTDICHFDLEDKINTIKQNSITNPYNAIKVTREFAKNSYSKIPSNLFPVKSANNIDRLLYTYKKELAFHYDLITSYFNDFIANDKIDTNLRKSIMARIPELESVYDGFPNTDSVMNDLKRGIYLPNVFSRVYFMRYLFEFVSYDLIQLILDYICKSTFPLYERTFFITLYDCFDGNIDKMRAELANYVDQNYNIITQNYIWKLGDKKSGENCRAIEAIYNHASFELVSTNAKIFKSLIIEAFHKCDIRSRYASPLSQTFQKDFFKQYNS